MLVWDETDVMACLETAPVVGEYDVSHSFTVAKDGLRLEIDIQQFDGDVSIRLFRDTVASAVFEVTLLNCAGIRYVDDKMGERIEFAPAKAFGTRHDGLSPPPFGISVAVKPGIEIRMFGRDV